jgi:hypothetical protein
MADLADAGLDDTVLDPDGMDGGTGEAVDSDLELRHQWDRVVGLADGQISAIIFASSTGVPGTTPSRTWTYLGSLLATI